MTLEPWVSFKKQDLISFTINQNNKELKESKKKKSTSKSHIWKLSF